MWFKVDDQLAFHRKALRAGNAAMGVWVRCGSHCGQQLTDGIVDPETAQTIGRPADFKRLVDADLWHTHGHACEVCPDPPPRHFVFHEWNRDSSTGSQRNPTRKQLEEKRRADAQRLADWRARQAARKQKGDQSA